MSPHAVDYVSRFAHLIDEAMEQAARIAALEAQIAEARRMATDEHKAAQDWRVSSARAGVNSSRAFDTYAAGVARRLAGALS